MDNKVWVYLCSQPLEGELLQSVRHELESFISSWQSHGTGLQASYKILYHRFIYIEVNEAAHQASGCSIDSQLRFIKQLEEKHKISLLNRLLVGYKKEKEVEVVKVSEIEDLIQNGVINMHSCIFNTSVSNVSEFNSHFEVEFHKSWIYIKTI